MTHQWYSCELSIATLWLRHSDTEEAARLYTAHEKLWQFWCCWSATVWRPSDSIYNRLTSDSLMLSHAGPYDWLIHSANRGALKWVYLAGLMHACMHACMLPWLYDEQGLSCISAVSIIPCRCVICSARVMTGATDRVTYWFDCVSLKYDFLFIYLR